MNSMLDVVIDQLIAGARPMVFVLQGGSGPCRHPLHTPLTSYGYGCRCPRCTGFKNEYQRGWRHERNRR